VERDRAAEEFPDFADYGKVFWSGGIEIIISIIIVNTRAVPVEYSACTGRCSRNLGVPKITQVTLALAIGNRTSLPPFEIHDEVVDFALRSSFVNRYVHGIS
jgi:hypothetical protein